ncbi:MAG: sigma-54-dependent Fis family transcriptional regulator [Deltaproteobacteria bacterium]|nr:sigma-54-dependent Fis family transcriptional regulator [Deltaproteobacteria bacterium]
MKLLIVDDEKLLRDSLKKHFQREGYQVYLAESARKAIEAYREYVPELVLLDVRLPDGNGLDVLHEIREVNPEALVILITAYGGIRSAVEAIKQGAQDYITKPFDIEELSFTVQKTTELFRLKEELRSIKDSTARKYEFGKIVTQGIAMKKACEEALKVAQTENSTVIVRGESGTGKELLCRAIHYNSSRRDMPFVPVNCASLPESLLESELFGYEKGAFTGATKRKIGFIESAEGGTIFLDEVGDISPGTQVKLLRFLQEQEYYRVGGVKPVRVNVRVVAATNRNLEKGLENGTFREDLYYRLHVFPIFIPPLRERKEDIPLLAKHIMETFNREFGKSIQGFSSEAMDALENYTWKGNVRELKNVIERSIILAEGQWILAADLPPEIRGAVKSPENPGDLPFPLAEGHILPLDQLETIYIQKVLEYTGGNKSLACRHLGITRNRLRRKLGKN